MKQLKTRQDVRQRGDETLAWEIYENEIDVATLPNDVLREIIVHIKPARNKLNEEYMTGDRLCYPPDWYDSRRGRPRGRRRRSEEWEACDLNNRQSSAGHPHPRRQPSYVGQI